MLKRIKSKTGKPLCLWEKANVLIHKQDYNWFKITVFVKNWPTVFSDWFNVPMDCENKLEYRDKLIIEEVNDILDDWNGWNLIPDLVEENIYQELED